MYAILTKKFILICLMGLLLVGLDNVWATDGKSKQTISAYLIAAHLADLGYLTGDIKSVDLKALELALSHFQKDIGVSPTGQLDETTWQKLSSFKLSTRRQKELDALNKMRKTSVTAPQGVNSPKNVTITAKCTAAHLAEMGYLCLS